MSLIPQTAWAEDSPAGSDNIALGDNRIREMKTQIREVIDVDHDFPSSGQAADVGQHKQVTLQEQADLGTGAVGATILGSQTYDGKGELTYTDEEDNDIQLTKSGEFYPGATPTLAHWVDVLKLVYPVGSIYMNASVSTDPATLLGFGTWATIGAGRVPVAIDAGQTEFDTLGETGGSKTVDISHTHTVAGTYNTDYARDPGLTHVAGTLPSGNPITTSSSGSATTSILQPYVVCAIWKRTA